jgi:hypothetical protein
MTWLAAVLAGMVAGLVLGVVIDKDVLYKIGRIKLKGSGHHLDLDLNSLPPGVKKRHIKRLERLKRKLRE